MSLLTKNLPIHGLPIIALSMFLHVGVAAALVAGAGHPAKASPSETILEVDLETTVETPAPIPAPEDDDDDDHHHVAAAAAPPQHTHQYDVAPSHDARPHDPSIVHAPLAAAAPAEPPPVLSAPAESAPMPRFTIALGNNTSAKSGPVVASGGAGSGFGSGSGGVTAAPEAPLPESAVSTPAKLLASVIAAYPSEARQNEIEADVPVEIVVDTRGAVIDARVVKHAGSGFDESARAAIMRYRFTPAQRDGKSVSVRMRWSVQFRLR